MTTPARFLAAVTFGFTLSVSALTQPLRVSSALSSNQDVGSHFAFSPDARFAVYTSNTGQMGRNELIRVRLSSGDVLTGLGHLNIIDMPDAFQITADSRNIVFIASIPGSLSSVLYLVEIDNPLPKQISTPTIEPTVIREFRMSANGSRVLYAKGNHGSHRYDLYIASVDGTTNRRVSGAESFSGRLLNFDLSGDGAYAIYQIENSISGSLEVFSASTTTTSIRKISAPMPADRDVKNFYVTRDSTRIVLRSDADVDDLFELYSVPIAGGVVTKVSGTETTRGGVRFPGHFRTSPDSKFVVFITAKSPSDASRIFSTDLLTGSVVELTGEVTSGGHALDFQISPDSKFVAFRGDLDVDGQSALYVVPITGGNRSTITSSSGAYIDAYAMSPDGTQLVFYERSLADSSGALYSTQLHSVYVRPIAGASHLPGAALNFQISADSRHVVFLQERNRNQDYELFSVPIEGGQIAKLSGELNEGRSVSSLYRLAADGSRVLFRADVNLDNVYELYRVQIGGSALALDIDGDDVVLASTDLAMIKRYTSGFRDIAVSDGLLGGNAAISDPAFIQDRISAALSRTIEMELILDIDGDDRVLPLTDLLLLTRYQLGIRGSALIANALGGNATITGSTAIENRIRAALGVGLPF
jgi:Tol biopolymer transport system component